MGRPHADLHFVIVASLDLFPFVLPIRISFHRIAPLLLGRSNSSKAANMIRFMPPKPLSAEEQEAFLRHAAEPVVHYDGQTEDNRQDR